MNNKSPAYVGRQVVYSADKDNIQNTVFLLGGNGKFIKHYRLGLTTQLVGCTGGPRVFGGGINENRGMSSDENNRISKTFVQKT